MHALQHQARILEQPGGGLAVAERTGKEEPERVEGDGEEVVEEKQGFWCQAARRVLSKVEGAEDGGRTRIRGRRAQRRIRRRVQSIRNSLPGGQRGFHLRSESALVRRNGTREGGELTIGAK